MIQIRPLLLAILSKFEKKAVKDAFRRLVSVAVRFQIVGGVGGGTLERIYADTAKSITENKIKSAKEVTDAFRTLPTDAAFEAGFSIASISKPSLARFYLRSLEEGMSAETEERVPNTDVEKVNLEHVLPLTVTEEWEKIFSKDDTRAYQKRLGNLALMSSKSNSKAGNDSFTEKRKVFAKSTFHFTKIIGSKKIWNKKEIEQRQNEMAKLAVKIWPSK